MIVASFILGILLFYFWMKYLHYLDQQRTPYGWEFNYQWFSLIFVAGFLTISSELIYRKIKPNSYLLLQSKQKHQFSITNPKMNSFDNFPFPKKICDKSSLSFLIS